MNADETRELIKIERTQRRLVDLVTLLETFHRDYDKVVTDEVLRFELVCEQMFGKFVFQDNGIEDQNLRLVSNLDTGDALPHPFPPFVAALQAEFAEVAIDAHHYYQPGSIESLQGATLSFLEREGFHTRRPLSELLVLPGYGTTQIYDSLCKVHIETAGDTVLVPELGYGFFLTQPCRIGGRVAVVACDDQGVVSAATLAAAIEEQNLQLWRDWKRDSEMFFNRSLGRLVTRGYAKFTINTEEKFFNIRDLLASAPDAWRSRETTDLLVDVAPMLTDPTLLVRAINTLRPPRVVAFLHVQPSVTGHIYTESEVDKLAMVLHQRRVVAFEDIAYHSIRCRLSNLASLQGTVAVTYTMLGVSKPMAVANLRLGLLLVDKSQFGRANRSIESSIGFVSVLLQRALATALLADGFDEYISGHSWGSHGYEARENIMYRLLTGGPAGLDDAARGVLCSAISKSSMLNPFVEDFLSQGLARWFVPVVNPEAGFFQVISCTPLLSIASFRRLGIRSSFDVFALLAYLFDLRTIPEEGMRPGGTPGTRLRIAFSPDSAIVARLFLRAFVGLSRIELGAERFPDLGFLV
jgi:aspartate/methionine/tyrosine aminotransferase